MFGAWISEVLGGQRGTASWCLGEGEAPPPPVRNALHLQSLRGSRGEEAASRPRARLSGCPSRSRGAFVREALRRGRTRPTSLPAEAPPSAQRRAAPLGTCPRLRDHRSHFGAMLGPPVWALVAGVLLALSPGRAGGAPRAGRRPARTRGCADRPEELLEQLYGRLAAGVLGAFHHTLQLGPREQARNASCPAGGRPADRRFRPPTNLRSVSPWAYRGRAAPSEGPASSVHLSGLSDAPVSLAPAPCQDLLRPRPLPQVPARGLLPVPGLPDRAARGGGRAAAQRPGARACGGPAPDPGLRGRPRRLHRGVHHHPRGLHLHARAGQGCRRRQLQPGQAGPALSTRPHGDPEAPRKRGRSTQRWTALHCLRA
ncbi:interleukin-17D isoform X1 [Eubalaena glacialis]|uniref:interleukin-17D isoform X1 n=1 Tax=Eubalaena glacialis TaxID=27606 RepID=UPI002A59AF33|nr:interleukin-17D isoform X1 [Eubalaena glacialis]